jgi:hypothetical protein
VRLTVQELLSGATLADHASQASERVAQELPVRVGERRRVVAAGNQVLGERDGTDIRTSS